MADQDNFGSFVLGFILGGIAGAAASLLLAPKSGEETRTAIRDIAIELRDKANVTAEEASKSIDQIAADARIRIDEYAKTAKTGVDELQKKGQAIIEDPKATIDEVVKTVKSVAAPKSETKPAADEAMDAAQ